MPRPTNALPYVCFAPGGESHCNCQSEPFTNDAIHHEDEQSKIWMGYRHDLNASYRGGMSFGQVLAQARSNLSKAMEARPSSTKRANWREAFPGFVTRATSDVLQQLNQGKRAFKQATCPSPACESESELLQVEYISIKSSMLKTEVFLVGYVFQLQGHEMIAICRNYSSSLYRFQRTDGSVSPDMFLTVHSKPSPRTEDKASPRASSKKSIGDRQSSRLHVPNAPEDEDLADGSSLDESMTTTPQATDDSPAQASQSAQGLEDTTNDDKQEVTPAQTFVGTLSTTDEYTGMITQICFAYGVSVLRMPNIAPHIVRMEQAVRENRRLALCQSFAKVKTILVVTAANVNPDFLDEEYEAMVSSAVTEFGVDLLNSTEGVMFMEAMGEAMVAGQREGLGAAYAYLRAYMTAYTGLD